MILLFYEGVSMRRRILMTVGWLENLFWIVISEFSEIEKIMVFLFDYYQIMIQIQNKAE